MADRDAAFREALLAYRDAVYLGLFTKFTEAAEARVLALYAEAQQQGERDQLALAEQVAEATMRMEQGRAERQGEVYEVQVIRSEYDLVGIVLDDDGYSPGDKVRVTKVEEGQ